MGTEPSQGGHGVGSRGFTSALRLSLSLRMPQSLLVYVQRWVTMPILSRRLEAVQHPKKYWTRTWRGFRTSSRLPWDRSSDAVLEEMTEKWRREDASTIWIRTKVGMHQPLSNKASLCLIWFFEHVVLQGVPEKMSLSEFVVMTASAAWS